jgi:hypothetical protein
MVALNGCRGDDFIIKKKYFTTQEWKHLVSVIHLESMTGDKQTQQLLKKMLASGDDHP